MKARVACVVMAWLSVAACNRPDSVLFSDIDTLPGSSGGTDGQNSPGGSAGGGQASPAAGSGGTPSSGGSGMAPPGDGGAAGDDTGAAGGADGGSGGAPHGGGGGGGTSGSAMAGGGTGGKPEPPEPVCGNGKLEAGEECDDAGHEGKDGCDASCQVVCSHFGEGSVKSEDAHCYLGFDENDFEGATADCAARGGHLVSISSAAENEIVSTFVRNSKWIGGFEDVAITNPGDGLYEWVTGEPFAYENWADEEPDRAEFRCSSGGGSGVAIRCYQHCALMQGGGTWIDSRCDMADGYVCEWEPAGD